MLKRRTTAVVSVVDSRLLRFWRRSSARHQAALLAIAAAAANGTKWTRGPRASFATADASITE